MNAKGQEMIGRSPELMLTTKLICVYCGAGTGNAPSYATAARHFGELLASKGYGLVYGATEAGLMRIVSQAVLEGGGDVVGVIPANLAEHDLARPDCTETFVVDSMHARKAKMLELAEAVVVLPGGIGTLDELFEALTWRDLGIHSKPIALLDVANYWAPLIALIQHATEQGFVRSEVADLLPVYRDPELLLDALAARPADDFRPRWSR